MLLSPEGRPLWTAKAYGTTFPVVDEVPLGPRQQYTPARPSHTPPPSFSGSRLPCTRTSPSPVMCADCVVAHVITLIPPTRY